MKELHLLRDLVVLLGLTIPVVALARAVRVPPIVGFLLTGVAIGPHGFALIDRPEGVEALAELGLVLLLFTIGLELSVSRILGMGRAMAQGGLLQVGGTMALVAVPALLLGVRFEQAILYGALAALSSTAIVLKAYADRGELDAPHGRVVVAILLFQDLSVVALMLLIPVLAQAGSTPTLALAVALGKSVLVVGVLVATGRVVVPRVLDRVVLLRDRELFTLSVAFLGLGAALLTAGFGLSLALGAFLAGLVVSESEYGLQALSDVLPFRDTFTGIFFTSVGMLLDLGFAARHAGLISAVAAAIVLGKLLVAAGVVLSLRRTLEASLRAGIGLAQVGEFSFVLAVVAVEAGLLGRNEYQLFLAAAVVTMLAAPFAVAGAGTIAGVLARAAGRPTVSVLPHEKPRVAALQDHAIIVGYGLSGRSLARVLRAAGVPYLALEQNGSVVRAARRDGVSILFGDGTRGEVLERVGLERARVVVFAISAPADERRGVAVARHLNPAVRIIVRTRYVRAIDELRRLGADEVVVEEYEATLELFARVLERYEVPSNVAARELQALRAEHYGMLRRAALGDLRLDALRHLGIHRVLELVEAEEGAVAVGESPGSLALRRETGAVVIAVVRDGQALYTPDPSFRFRAGDTVVLVGDTGALGRAVRVFRAPAADAV